MKGSDLRRMIGWYTQGFSLASMLIAHEFDLFRFQEKAALIALPLASKTSSTYWVAEVERIFKIGISENLNIIKYPSLTRTELGGLSADDITMRPPGELDYQRLVRRTLEAAHAKNKDNVVSLSAGGQR